MRKTFEWTLLGLLAVVLAAGPAAAECASGQCAPDNDTVVGVAKADLQDRTKLSGTLDLYDAGANRVRNLRLTTAPQEVSVQNNEYAVLFLFRDINSGEVMEVNSLVSNDSGDWAVKDWELIGVRKKPGADEDAVKKEYTDEEIQQVMKDYLDSQVKFSDHLMLFDEERNRMRNLDLVELKPEVRRLGILNISRANFVDADTGDELGVDVTVENRKGVLTMQSLRIRDLKRARRTNEE